LQFIAKIRYRSFLMGICSKKFLTTLLTAILIAALMVPAQVFAKDTLGTENPSIQCVFTDDADNVYDGNSLDAGNYNVAITLSGMSTVSIFNIEASFTDDVTINSATANSSFSTAALNYDENKFVAILTSENDSFTSVADGEIMVTLSVTVNTAGDFADYFVFSTDPDLTFVEADYDDGYEACYVEKSNESTDDKYPLLTLDASPSAGYDVTGQITIATNADGSAGTVGIVGITVSVDGTDISAVTDKDGYYTLSGVPEGTYTLTISGPTTIDRNVTLVVYGSKIVTTVPIVICDYNQDGYVTGLDSGTYSAAFNGTYNVYCDLNGDGDITGLDTGTYSAVFGKTIDYKDVIL
jgi:hypothetical protein